MKSFKNLLKRLWSTPRIRILIIVIAVIVVFVVTINLMGHKTEQSKNTAGKSSISMPELHLQDNQASQYQMLKNQYIDKEAHAALQDGSSYFAMGDENAHKSHAQPSEPQTSKPQSPTDYLANQPPEKPNFFAQKLKEQQLTNREREQLEMYRNQLSDSMRNVINQQTHQQGTTIQSITLSSTETTSLDRDNASVNAQNNVAADYTAGSVLYAVIDTAINSDQPSTPVLATIITGPYRHAKLLGAFSREGKKLVIKFNTLSPQDATASTPINAYAIDANTAQTVLASDVDNHYMLRYGSLFASAFLEGFGTYFTNSQQVDLQRPTFWFDYNTRPKPTVQDAAYAGLGKIGSASSQAMQAQFNQPPTVTVDQGTAIGVLLMSDLIIRK